LMNFRAKFLVFLPVVTGAGLFAVLKKNRRARAMLARSRRRRSGIDGALSSIGRYARRPWQQGRSLIAILWPSLSHRRRSEPGRARPTDGDVAKCAFGYGLARSLRRPSRHCSRASDCAGPSPVSSQMKAVASRSAAFSPRPGQKSPNGSAIVHWR
jgi:hypothetical protein